MIIFACSQISCRKLLPAVEGRGSCNCPGLLGVRLFSLQVYKLLKWAPAEVGQLQLPGHLFRGGLPLLGMSPWSFLPSFPSRIGHFGSGDIGI